MRFTIRKIRVVLNNPMFEAILSSHSAKHLQSVWDSIAKTADVITPTSYGVDHIRQEHKRFTAKWSTIEGEE